MDAGKLQDGGHAVEEATDDEPVQGRGVLDLGQVRPAVHRDSGEGEYGRDTWAILVSDQISVKPPCCPPRVTRSDVASLLSQNPTQDSTTIRAHGRYTWTRSHGGGVEGHMIKT